MPLPPEQAFEQASAKAANAADFQAAALLKEYFPALTFIAPQLHVPAITEQLQAELKKPEAQQDKEKIAALEQKEVEEYTSMARGLMQSGAIIQTIGGNVATVTVEEIDQKIEADEALKRKFQPFKDRFQVSSFEEGVNKLTALKAEVAESVGQAAQKNTGRVGLLRGATILNAIVGFFKWIVNLFTGGGMSLTQSIATVSANNAQSSVQNKLENLRAQRPDLAPLLQDRQIADIAGATRDGILAEVGFPNPNAPVPQRFRDIKPMTIEMAELREAVYQGVLNPGGQSLEDRIVKQYSDGVNGAKRAAGAGWNPSIPWVGSVHVPGTGAIGSTIAYFKAPGEENIRQTSHAMADVIASAVADTVSNPDYVDPTTGKKLSDPSLDKQARITIIADAVGAALVEQEGKTFSLPAHNGLKDTNPQGKTNLQVYLESIRSGLDAGYDKLEPVIAAVGRAEAQKLAATSPPERRLSPAAHRPSGDDVSPRAAGSPLAMGQQR